MKISAYTLLTFVREVCIITPSIKYRNPVDRLQNARADWRQKESLENSLN